MNDLHDIKHLLLNIVLSIKQELKANLVITNVQQKAYQDYVTNLDYDLENYLTKTIAAKLPDVEIFSEEQIKDRVEISGKKCIVIDPLDGTQNAACAIPYYAASIAYLEDGFPKIGITYDFMRDELFHASLDGGMFINDTKLNKNSISLDKKPITISNNFLTYFAEHKPELITAIRKVAKVRMLAAETLHLAYLASGRLRANFNFEAKFWDDAAGFVMLKEMGMQYVNFNNQNIFPKKYIDPQESLMSLAGNSQDVKMFIGHLNFAKHPL